MAKLQDRDLFHRVIGWIGAGGFFTFVSLPVLAIISVGECLPGGKEQVSHCVAFKDAELLALLVGLPFASMVVGWLAYRYSKFLG